MTFKAIHAGSIMEPAEKTWITVKESKSVRTKKYAEDERC
jgi:hypothetical protein